ncbi:MAG TPA: serine/threonine-protein kinase, partial [Kofleriaceae bacterium]|nr:serine/threonine-protein kinase [Kofleriaceae bacterium]
MRSNSQPPGAAALLRHTVVYRNGSANRSPRVVPRRRVVEAEAIEADDDEDDPTRLRLPMAATGRPGATGQSYVCEPHPRPLVREPQPQPYVCQPHPRAPVFQPERREPIVAGSIVGNYRILEPLANGGMGIVFLGEHLQLGRKVALKFLHERLLSDRWAVSRFFAEAVAASRISHPGAVSVFDYGSFEGGAYLVMEFLRGETLRARLERERRLPIPRVLDIGVQLALTLAAAHDAGVIHRDLKPDNIHLVPDPSGSGYEYVKVLDFGVAKLTAGSCVPQTQRGDLLGTPLYMAPEQSVHAGTVDRRCDIYSLGCLLYQLITGLAPFRGSMFEILIAHQNEPP